MLQIWKVTKESMDDRDQISGASMAKSSKETSSVWLQIRRLLEFVQSTRLEIELVLISKEDETLRAHRSGLGEKRSLRKPNDVHIFLYKSWFNNP